MKLVFFDLETSGLDSSSDYIREMSAIVRVNGRIVDQIECKGNNRSMYWQLVKMLDRHINKFDSKDKAFFTGWNSSFDMDFIRQLFLNNKNEFYGSYFWNPYYDIMQVALHALRTKRHRIENFKLSTVARFLKIPVRESQLHTAVYDNNLAKDVYNKLV